MSKPVIIDISHELGRAEARRRLEKGFGRIRQQFGSAAVGVEERWDGDRLNFSAAVLGQKIRGSVDVMEKSVRIQLDLPWGLGILADKLRGKVSRAGTLLLEKK